MRNVVFNQKGGVGKSTITCNLAAISAARGRDTVILDLDPSHKLSRELEALYDALDGKKTDRYVSDHAHRQADVAM